MSNERLLNSRVQVTAMPDIERFEKRILFNQFEFFVGGLPPELVAKGREEFDDYWSLHPQDYHLVKIGGRWIPVPRWQQAYEKPYKYTGNVNEALPLPALLRPYLAFGQQQIDPRLNGVLLNWYDFALQHHIGPHSDSLDGLLEGSPIVTISLGDERRFRLHRKGDKPDAGEEPYVPARHGSVFILPWRTNLGIKHSVSKPSEGEEGRRISITLRVFQ